MTKQVSAKLKRKKKLKKPEKTGEAPAENGAAAPAAELEQEAPLVRLCPLEPMFGGRLSCSCSDHVRSRVVPCA